MEKASYIAIDLKSFYASVECVGIHSGRESWTIIYAYRSDDKAMHKLVEKSIASISLG